MKRDRILPLGTPDEPRRDSRLPPAQRRRAPLLALTFYAINAAIWIGLAAVLIDWNRLRDLPW